MESRSKKTRITYKPTQPNPLFQSWLEELYEEAKSKQSKLESMLKEALWSLSKYPLPLNSGSECAILKGFGKKLCLFLDQKLEAYKSLNSEDNPPSTSQSDHTSQQTYEPVIEPMSIDVPETSSTVSPIKTVPQKMTIGKPKTKSPKPKPNSPKPKSPKTRKPYKPAYRTGGYAILVTLLNNCKENPTNKAMTKDQLIEKGQIHSEESFTRPKPDSHFTAWSTMARLLTKGLVTKTKSRKPEFSLTDEGIALANQVLNDYKDVPTLNDIIFNEDSFSNHSQENCIAEPMGEKCETSSQNSENGLCNIIEMPNGSFDVILLIDKMETSGAAKKNDPTVTQFKKYPDLKHEYRHLKVGDFTWIARSNTDSSIELVLPFVVERKRMDDLGHSIKDGRFHEQKFRLRKCGLKNVIYLVENFGSNKHVGLPLPSLQQALANTRVQDCFKVHMTDSLANTARFLAMMTKRLTVEYKDKTLKGKNGDVSLETNVFMTFKYFNQSSKKTKTLTVTENFIKILLQYRGMSIEKALAITKEYNTPRDLIEAYQDVDEKDGEMLLSYLKYGDRSKNVGPTVSKAIYQLFTLKDFH